MYAVFSRELAVIIACRAFAVVAAIHAVLMTIFLLGWTARLAPLVSMSPYEQVVRFDLIVVTLLLPWTAARCVAAERANELVLLSVLTSVRPSRVVLARAAALVAALVLVASTSAPIVLFAQRISAVEFVRVLVDEATLLTIAMISGPCVLLWRHAWANRYASWVAASLSAALGVTVIRSAPALAAPILAIAAGAVLVLALAARADVSLRYLAEHDA